MGELVKYDNKMNSLKFNNFTPVDFDMFIALCSKMKDQNLKEIEFNFSDLKKIMDYKSTSNERFINDLIRMNKKLMEISCDFRIGKKIIQFVLFPTFEVDTGEQTLKAKINEDFRFILNDFINNFTSFDLKEFLTLESKYAKTLFRLLKQFKKTGIYIEKIEDFRSLMGAPASYQNRDIMKRIIKPAIKELEKYFYNLRCVPVYAKKPGMPITAYKFLFESETKLKPVERKNIPVPKKNSFNDFEQRPYDKEIERLLEDIPGQMDIFNYPGVCPDN